MNSRTLGVFATVAGIAVLAFAPAHAGASGTGSISGNLTSAGNPVAKVCAIAYDASGDSVKYAISDVNGNYILDGLETGSYRVQFFTGNVQVGSAFCDKTNVLDEFYDDEGSLATATPVSVTDGSDTPDIDAQLAKGGSISGKVTVGANGPDGGRCVEAYNSSGELVKRATSDPNGDYAIVGLPTGSYRVGFFSCHPNDNVFDEYYPDKESVDDATPVSVTAGSDTPAINAHLAEGGSISGTIRGGYEGAGTCVYEIAVYDSTSQVVASLTNWFFADYSFSKLKPGSYRLKFDQWCVGPIPGPPQNFHVGEYFNDKQSLSDATPVVVTPGSAKTGTNVLLGDDGTISGTVTDTMGAALDGVCVEAFDSDGNPAGVVAQTIAGHYVVNALESGFYRLKFSDCVNPGDPSVTAEFYDDEPTLEDAVPVAVSKGAATAGIDAQLVTRPAAYKAAISKVRVNGPARVKRGKKADVTVAITNSGNKAAIGVQLRIRGRGVKFSSSVGSISANTTRVVKARLRAGKLGRTKLTFRVSSRNASGKSIRRSISVGR